MVALGLGKDIPEAVQQLVQERLTDYHSLDDGHAGRRCAQPAHYAPQELE